MGNNIAIEFDHVSKQYRLGLVSTKTLSHDIRRFWITNVLGKEDPYLKIGETNDRSTKGSSEYVWALKDINFKVEQGDVVRTVPANLHFSNSFPASQARRRVPSVPMVALVRSWKSVLVSMAR